MIIRLELRGPRGHIVTKECIQDNIYVLDKVIQDKRISSKLKQSLKDTKSILEGMTEEEIDKLLGEMEDDS